MEGNKDEAIKAKRVAERMFLENNIAGAKKIALKAERLYPELEGLDRVFAKLDIQKVEPQVRRVLDCNKDEAVKAKRMAERKFIAGYIAEAEKFALKAQKLYPELEGLSKVLEKLNVKDLGDTREKKEPVPETRAGKKRDCSNNCREKAVRLKEMAEIKFRSGDFAEAKSLAMEAQNLYIGLEGLNQMLATIDVHLLAENKVDGELDWYGILGVDPSADEDSIKKQYKKRALILHPDKNKSVWADGAFKLILNAWHFLSDKAKRKAYDRKRSDKHNFPSTSGERQSDDMD